MQRRTFMIGVGGAVTTGAAALGSGAFTQVDADRSTAVSVVNDSEGLLGIKADDSSEFITVDESTGVFEIDLDLENDENITATGVNPGAETRLDDAFSITNQSGQSIDVDISVDGADIIKLTGWTGGGDLTEGEDLITNTITLADGESIDDIDFVVSDGSIEDQVNFITITASSPPAA